MTTFKIVLWFSLQNVVQLPVRQRHCPPDIEEYRRGYPVSFASLSCIFFSLCLFISYLPLAFFSPFYFPSVHPHCHSSFLLPFLLLFCNSQTMKDDETLNANYEFYTGKMRFQPQGADIQICSMPRQLEAYTLSFFFCSALCT